MRGDNSLSYYLYHVPKTGGTSITYAFLAVNSESPKSAYEQLGQSSPTIIVLRGKTYIGWADPRIAQGGFFYAFSHTRACHVRLPPRTFALTVVRDPLARLLSQYRELRFYRDTGNPHPVMRMQGAWLGDSLADFVDRIPDEAANRQVHHWDRLLDPRRAVDEMLARVNVVLFTETLNWSVTQMGNLLGLYLKGRHERQAQAEYSLELDALEAARVKLAPDYAFYREVQRLWNRTTIPSGTKLPLHKHNTT